MVIIDQFTNIIQLKATIMVVLLVERAKTYRDDI